MQGPASWRASIALVVGAVVAAHLTADLGIGDTDEFGWAELSAASSYSSLPAWRALQDFPSSGAEFQPRTFGL